MLAIMLSVQISAYKGDIPCNHALVCIELLACTLTTDLCLQNILKRYWFNLPPGLEHDHANWEKVIGQVGYALTQACARVKKAVWMVLFTLQSLIFISNIPDQGEHPGEH